MKYMAFAKKESDCLFPIRTRKVLYYRTVKATDKRSRPENYSRLLFYLDRFITNTGYAPTYREIMAAMGYSSTSVVSYYLAGLENMGVITREKFKPRTIRVL